MVEADVDLLKSRACCVQLAVLLTTYCSSYQWLSLIAVEGTPFTLPPLDLGSEWLPPMAFINSGRGYSSHATTTEFGSGFDLEVVFLVDLQSTLLEPHARFLGSLKTRAAMMRRCNGVEVIDKRPGCGHDLMSG